MKRKSLNESACPIARSLDVIGDWWSLLVVRDALLGKRRFGEFQQSLGVARNILTNRLRKLVAEEVLEVVPASDGSAYREYALTDKGRGLHDVLIALQEWGENACPQPAQRKRVQKTKAGVSDRTSSSAPVAE